MKILIVSELNTGNTFTDELVQNILPYFSIVSVGVKEFWSKSEHFDIINFHWPEIIFNWKEPTLTEITKLENRLKILKNAGVKMIATRHNFSPHYKKTENFTRLYDLIYMFSNAIVHLGEFSRSEFLLRYKDRPFIQNQEQVIIPHGLYERINTSISRSEAREKLKIRSEEKIILVFGAIRSEEERKTVIDAYKLVKTPRKFLLAPRFSHAKKPAGRRKPLKRFYWELISFWYKNFSNLKLLSIPFVDASHLPIYFSAADVIWIPRLSILNSGNLVMGFGFGKVVVGPDTGNVGEILRKTGNPTYDSKSLQNISNALEMGLKLAEKEKGLTNLEYAKIHWGGDLIGKQYRDIIYKILSV